ncbi:MAG TPA: hypothetical protein PLG34_13760 [Spirochaetota bacterium]|jgi:hypothetical protein|nr:MAG: hypothetical protein BWX91_01928 [Spirochaetes bacterium ADurb.Bin133]HNZ27920.1 hypothetical protein [Spirochaetota bacterium]HPY89035.1 hypothetical protein [Spirochaetota bacterium]HQB62096.1 hypothetical protein [Spirochaetota bacterium]
MKSIKKTFAVVLLAIAIISFLMSCELRRLSEEEYYGKLAGLGITPQTTFGVVYATTALWAKSVTAGTDISRFNSVAVDSSGNVYAAGGIKTVREVILTDRGLASRGLIQAIM